MLGDLGGAAGDDFGTGEQLELGIFGEGEVSSAYCLAVLAIECRRADDTLSPFARACLRVEIPSLMPLSERVREELKLLVSRRVPDKKKTTEETCQLIYRFSVLDDGLRKTAASDILVRFPSFLVSLDETLEERSKETWEGWESFSSIMNLNRCKELKERVRALELELRGNMQKGSQLAKELFRESR